MIVNLERVTEGNLLSATECKVVARLGLGVNTVDVEAATALRSWAKHVRDYCIVEIADQMLAITLAPKLRLRKAHSKLEYGVWIQPAYHGLSPVLPTAVGIVGLGVLGREVVLRCTAIRLQTITFDPACGPGKCSCGTMPTDIDTFLPQSYVVTPHVPLASSTRDFINAEHFGRIRLGTFLIYVARCGLVDDAAFTAALEGGHLASAALDAFQRAPLSPSSPLIGRRSPLLTIHVCFLSEESFRSFQEQTAAKVLRVLRGERTRKPVNEVHPRGKI